MILQPFFPPHPERISDKARNLPPFFSEVVIPDGLDLFERTRIRPSSVTGRALVRFDDRFMWTFDKRLAIFGALHGSSTVKR